MSGRRGSEPFCGPEGRRPQFPRRLRCLRWPVRPWENRNKLLRNGLYMSCSVLWSDPLLRRSDRYGETDQRPLPPDQAVRRDRFWDPKEAPWSPLCRKILSEPFSGLSLSCFGNWLFGHRGNLVPATLILHCAEELHPSQSWPFSALSSPSCEWIWLPLCLLFLWAS